MEFLAKTRQPYCQRLEVSFICSENILTLSCTDTSTHTNSYIHTHTACWICPSLSLFLLTSLNRPVCSSGFICEDTMLWRRRKRGGVEIQQFSACLKLCSLHTEQQFEGPRHLHLPPTEWRSDTNSISTPGM